LLNPSLSYLKLLKFLYLLLPLVYLLFLSAYFLSEYFFLFVRLFFCLLLISLFGFVPFET
jgi:hypothetical protein